MPYVIETRRRLHCTCWGTVGEDESGMCNACHKGGQDVSRRAALTLDGQPGIVDAGKAEAVVHRAGSLGWTDPDTETSVEIRHVQYQTLADLIREPYRCPGSDEDRAAAVARYNAAQEADRA